VSGIHHLVLVSSDMARTVHFYRDMLGFRLVKSLDLPRGFGQHFFFDIGNGDTLGFLTFKGAPEPAVGVTSPTALPSEGDFRTAPGSMNHVAMKVALDKVDAYYRRLTELGIHCAQMAHDDSEWQIAEDPHAADVWLRSLYFFDPDGHLLEFAAWGRQLNGSDLVTEPLDRAGKRVPLQQVATLSASD
jgi:catechol 2,3-dioxygenase-like lactoylglutathione lyase family enzyme